MSHELFESVTAPVNASARSPYTIAGSIVAHVAIVTVIVIAPLIAVDRLPAPHEVLSAVHVIDQPLPPEPAPPAIDASTPSAANPDVSRPPADTIPVDASIGIRDEGPPRPDVPSIGSNDAGRRVLDDVFGDRRYVAAPPTVAAPTGPMRTGGVIREPQKVFNVAPVYPPIALQARIEGTVVIEATIDVDGTVREARVVSGVPMLDRAALDAVRQWRYRPTTLNGVPVAIIMTVSVRFALR